MVLVEVFLIVVLWFCLLYQPDKHVGLFLLNLKKMSLIMLLSLFLK